MYTVKSVITILVEAVLVYFTIYFTVVEINIDTPYDARYIKASMIVMMFTHSFNIIRLSWRIYWQVRRGVNKK